MSPSILPVLIVGGGPTGLTLAIECCRHNVPFRIIEQKPMRDPYSKALALWHGTMQTLKVQGILEPFLEAGILVKQISFADRGRVVGSVNPQNVHFSQFNAPIVLAQSETERILEEKLNQEGGKLERGITLIDFSQGSEQIEVKLQHGEGHVETFQVAWLAACDGARSTIRKKLEHTDGFEFKGYTEPETFMLADSEFTGDYENNQIMISWDAKNVVLLFPVTPKILRILFQRKNNSTLPPTLEEAQAQIDQAGPRNLKLINPKWLSLFHINERLSSHYQKGRTFLLGDAAHIHSPAGGQGMNTGMQDAYNLAWKLPFLLKSKQPSALLASYQQERRPIAEEVIKKSSQKLHFGMMQNPLMRVLKDSLLPILTHIKPIQHKLLAELSELFIEYKESTLIIPNTSMPKAKRPGKKWLDIVPSPLFGTHHVLLVFYKTTSAFANFKKEIQALVLNLDIEIIEMPSPDENATWYLLRPDQFIAAADHLDTLVSLKQYVLKITA